MIWDLDICGSLLPLSKSLGLDIHFLGGLLCLKTLTLVSIVNLILLSKIFEFKYSVKLLTSCSSTSSSILNVSSLYLFQSVGTIGPPFFCSWINVNCSENICYAC